MDSAGPNFRPLTHGVVHVLAQRLFLTQVPGRCENGKARGDHAFEPPKQDTNDAKLGVVVASAEEHDHGTPEDEADTKSAA